MIKSARSLPVTLSLPPPPPPPSGLTLQRSNSLRRLNSGIHRRPRSLLSRARSWVHIVAIAVLCLCAFGALYFEARVDLSQARRDAQPQQFSRHRDRPQQLGGVLVDEGPATLRPEPAARGAVRDAARGAVRDAARDSTEPVVLDAGRRPGARRARPAHSRGGAVAAFQAAAERAAERAAAAKSGGGGVEEGGGGAAAAGAAQDGAAKDGARAGQGRVACGRGAPPAEQRRFCCMFSCGGLLEPSIPCDRVNDDFCDCANGSDEPGTAACSAQGAHFQCADGRRMSTAFVDDGIRDCKGGEDERASTLGAVS